MSKEAQDLKNSADGHRARLRGRFLKNGLESFAEYEIAELMLTLAIPRIDVKPIAKDLIRTFGNLRGVLDASPEALMRVNGIGQNAATAIAFIRKLIPIYMQQELGEEKLSLDTIDKMIAFFRARIAGEKNEVMEVACFNARLELLPCGVLRLFEGSASGIRVDFRKIIESALKHGATSIVIAHNHPGGDCTPTPQDIDFTLRLSKACRPISLSFIEHIIVSKNSSFSFRRGGHFDKLYDEAEETQSTAEAAEGVASGVKILRDA